jgi:MtN3 and saliva related transmembrane protein
MIPQLYKTFETKSVGDLSLFTLLLILLTNILWLLHGYFIKDTPLLISACISMVINSMLLVLYLNA